MLEVNVDKQAHRNIFQLKHTGLFPSPETVDTTSPAVIFGIFEISYVSFRSIWKVSKQFSVVSQL